MDQRRGIKMRLLFEAMLDAIRYNEPVAAARLHDRLGPHSATGCPLCGHVVS